MLAGLVFQAGLAVSGFLTASCVRDFIAMRDDLTRVVVPGEGDVTFAGAGKYTIFYESRSEVAGRRYATSEDVPSLQVTLVSRTTGEQASLTPVGPKYQYTVGGYQGRAILDARIDQPGTYELSASYPSGARGPQIVLAVGRNVLREGLLRLAAAGAIFVAGTGIAVLIAVLTFVRRRRNL